MFMHLICHKSTNVTGRESKKNNLSFDKKLYDNDRQDITIEKL